jgi:excisionase family DNA binding protein
MKTAHHLPPLDERQRYSIEEATDYLRTSRARLYEKIGAGEVKIVKDGRRTYVPGSEIARLSCA